MSRLEAGASVPLGLPIGGMDLNQPLASMAEINSPWLLNVDCENQQIAARPGIVRHCVISGVDGIRALGVYGTPGSFSDSLFAYCYKSGSNHTIYDVSTSTPSLVHTCADNDGEVQFPANINTRLMFLSNLDAADCARVWDGSSWSAWNFTYGGSALGSYTAINYRSRAYIFVDQKMYYGAVSAVSGATTEVDLGDIFDQAGGISWAAVFPFSNSNINDTYLAFGTRSGEILVYSGSYPASATWSLVQKFTVDPGLGNNAILRFKNDVWILTRTGIVSLGALLTSGVTESIEYSPSYPINDYWSRLSANYSSGIWGADWASICYWPEKNRIYVLLPGSLDESGTYDGATHTICSYNTLTRAWSLWAVTNIGEDSFGSLTYYQNAVYLSAQNAIMKIDPTVFKDETYSGASSYSAYPYVIDGAYSDFGTRNKGKRIHAISPLFRTDFAGSKVGVKVTADMGRLESGTANVDLVDGFNAPYYQAGVDGKRVKYRISGTSDTASVDGFKLFAADAVIGPQGGVR